MSWMQKLCEVYEACERSGNIIGNYEASPVFVPLYHSTQQAQVELTITEQGELVRGSARAIADKAKMETVIPVTEKSASRTSSPEPMPLFDKLAYVAGDYGRYFPLDKERKTDPHQLYLAALQAWCASPFAHGYVRAWLAYVQAGTLVSDLLAEGVFSQAEDGSIAAKWAGGGKPEDAFVRFSVQTPDEWIHPAWLELAISEAFIQYQRSQPAEVDLCYATGISMPTSATSPKFIRYPGDGAKLISANDTSGFTFRGRFETPQEALSLGRDTTEKAHAALKWLIRKQGYRNGDQVVLAFGTGQDKPLSPMLDSVAALEDDSLGEFSVPYPDKVYNSMKSTADMLSNAIRSLSGRLPAATDAIVMGLDSATPGRMAIFYYRKMGAKDYLDRVAQWHATCTWRHTYRWVQDGRDDNGKVKSKNVPFEGAPSLMDIVLAAYGEKVSDKLKKSALERLVPCVVDSANVPKDIVEMLVRRAAQRAAMDDAEREKTLSIACALVKKQRIEQKLKGALEVGIDYNNRDRDYLFGRVLACAEMIERVTLDAKGEDRITNAERFMVAYTKHPASTLCLIKTKLQIYINRAKKKGEDWLDRWVDEFYILVNMLTAETFNDSKLGNLYLLGYASQRMRMKAEYKSKNKSGNALKEEE